MDYLRKSVLTYGWISHFCWLDTNLQSNHQLLVGTYAGLVLLFHVYFDKELIIDERMIYQKNKFNTILTMDFQNENEGYIVGITNGFMAVGRGQELLKYIQAHEVNIYFIYTFYLLNMILLFFVLF